jgi:CRISPR/Cas system-associated exonuclease Cas4 (RecB family)
VVKNRIGFITPSELDESLDEAAGVAREVLADRSHFDRTAERERCARCDFRRVCDRTT